MTEKDLKKMGRRELIEIIAAQKRTELELRERLAKAEAELSDRTIQIANAGSIAEAALSLNDVFSAAQAAADTYLQSIYSCNSDLEKRISQAEEESARILENAEKEAQARIQEAEKLSADKIAEADAQINQRWSAFQENVEKVLHSSSELSVFLNGTQKR